MSILTKRLFPTTRPPSVRELDELCSLTTKAETYPLAAKIEENIPIYNIQDYQTEVDADEEEEEEEEGSIIHKLEDEWYHNLVSGPGVFVLKGMYGEDNKTTANNNSNSASSSGYRYADALSKATTAYQRIINEERLAGGGGDHFASKGANDRIWNSFSKHAIIDPSSFTTYYSNPWLSHVSNAWLGPGYRITAQVNVVKPGGKQQNVHRDYHLGFQDDRTCHQYPRSMHIASQFLTLQGAVAHTDMPVASGPTWLLPFSQQFPEGYLAWRLPEFQRYFDAHYVSIPLEKGDGIFFNPALFHAAGANRTEDFERMANLLQISSAFGKTMESIDSVPIVERCWGEMVRMYDSSSSASASASASTSAESSIKEQGKELSLEVSCLIRAIADGYPFPTNLDHRPPAPSGLAPESEQDILVRGLKAGWTRDKVVNELKQMRLDSADGAVSFA